MFWNIDSMFWNMQTRKSNVPEHASMFWNMQAYVPEHPSMFWNMQTRKSNAPGPCMRGSQGHVFELEVSSEFFGYMPM